MKTVGILLAGGLSRRFGSPKAFAKWNGASFYELSLRALSPFCDEVVIVTRPELVDAFPSELFVITDVEAFAGKGPVAGILSGMEAVEADRYIVMPCDMPLLKGETIGRLVACHVSGVTAVISDGRHHPLVSMWDQDAQSVLRSALLEGQRRVMTVQENVGMSWVQGDCLTENALEFMNVNTPHSLKGVDGYENDCR